MKIIMTLVLLFSGFVFSESKAEEVEKKDNIWLTLQDDDGVDESYWGVSSSPKQILCKKINIGIDPQDIKGCKLHYKIGYDLYDPKLKKHTSEYLGNISIFINDKLTVNKPAKELATRGWHIIIISPALLKKGENTISFSWTELDNNTKELRYGVFYMAIDTSSTTSRMSLSSNDGGKTFTIESLRPGAGNNLLYKGEYMVRLEIGVPAENGKNTKQ